MEQVMKYLNDFVKFLKTNVSIDVAIYILVAVLVLILILLVSKTLKRRKAESRFKEMEMDINDIRNNSLEFKFNKAKAFAKSNNEVLERVQDLTPKYQICKDSVEHCIKLYDEVDELLDRHKAKKALRTMDEMKELMDETQERIRIVNQGLDNILQKEKEIREYSNALKERFRNLKTVYEDKRPSYFGASQYFDSRFQEIENDFSSFEEWMYASEFNKAKEEEDKIARIVDEVSSQMGKCPGLYEKAKTTLPQAIKEVKALVEEAKGLKIDLTSISPESRLENLEATLSASVELLDRGNLGEAERVLTEITDEVISLQDEVSMERTAYEEIHNDLIANLGLIDTIDTDLTEIKNLYGNIKDRFGLEDWSHRFTIADARVEDLRKQRDDLKGMLDVEKPSREMINQYRTYVNEVVDFGNEIRDMKKLLIGASSDESRAQKQLVKLQLILNEVRLNANIRQLPSISEQFDKDILQGEDLIKRVKVVLSHSPLDVPMLNADLQDAIDFVYKLYNNANNLSGVAVMVENAIVFGNRFRSTYPAMDSELTRAELCFQNGEYTRALKIAIQAIESLHPGIYEKLVAQKDPAVMNQA
ncbi:MAG: negative regulator of septation ring formation [Firmicutes bacterium]|nr:negative regulator of septation ring formation [Bacillota bacterium]